MPAPGQKCGRALPSNWPGAAFVCSPPSFPAETRPFLRPLQKVVPTVANVDLSPLIVLLICQLLIAVPLLWLEKTVGRLL